MEPKPDSRPIEEIAEELFKDITAADCAKVRTDDQLWESGKRIKELEAENKRLGARTAELEHQAECYWYDLAAGSWARDHCKECDRLHKAVEAAAAESASTPAEPG